MLKFGILRADTEPRGSCVAMLYDRAGASAVRRLFDAFRLDGAALAARLAADVDPGLAEFSLRF